MTHPSPWCGDQRPYLVIDEADGPPTTRPSTSWWVGLDPRGFYDAVRAHHFADDVTVYARPPMALARWTED